MSFLLQGFLSCYILSCIENRDGKTGSNNKVRAIFCKIYKQLKSKKYILGLVLNIAISNIYRDTIHILI